ncbi:ParB/RepB/Spo0J family partition protein [Acaryochloris marina NIES-2412]|uniref:ParB/RepB/Spo0J family partition protein n=1 Tax=Acaryochloris marina TaxID=155978 RepID=UPI00405A0EB1
MPSKDRFDDIFAAVKNSHNEDSSSPTSSKITLSLDEIQDRFLGDTRPPEGKHVSELAESIAVLGLIEPLAVDDKNRLLAGGHRQAALHLLKRKNPKAFKQHFPNDQVQVRVMPFDSEKDPNLALAIEAAENEKRRDYTPTEVKAIAERLKSAGYEDLKGRPKKGQKALMPALSVVIGKSVRTVQRHLYGNSEVDKKSATDVVLLNRALISLQKWQQTKPKTSAQKALSKQLPDILKLIERSLGK